MSSNRSNQFLIRRAGAAGKAGNHQEAADAYREYLRDDPSDGGIWHNLGLTLKVMERYDEAIEAYAHAFPLLEEFHFRAFANKKIRESIESCISRVLIDVGEIDGYRNSEAGMDALKWASVGLSQNQEALWHFGFKGGQFDRELEQRSSTVRKRNFVVEATTFLIGGDLPKAIDALLKAIHLTPNDVNAWKLLSEAYLRSNRPIEANEAARKAAIISAGSKSV